MKSYEKKILAILSTMSRLEIEEFFEMTIAEIILDAYNAGAIPEDRIEQLLEMETE